MGLRQVSSLRKEDEDFQNNFILEPRRLYENRSNLLKISPSLNVARNYSISIDFEAAASASSAAATRQKGTYFLQFGIHSDIEENVR